MLISVERLRIIFRVIICIDWENIHERSFTTGKVMIKMNYITRFLIALLITSMLVLVTVSCYKQKIRSQNGN